MGFARRAPALGLLVAGVVVGWTGPALRAKPESAPRYLPGCLAFFERVRTSIRSQSGSAVVEDRAGRDGVMVVELRGPADSMALAAWYDSLSVWRATNISHEEPDVEGFLGGRYRGTLTPDGRYTAAAWPFIPSAVAEVADLGSVMDDFLPRLPRVDLEPGASWSDSGLTVRREADLDGRGGRVRRFTWASTRRVSDRVEATDTVTIAVEQMVKEEGDLRWSPEEGPVGWRRHLEISAHVPARAAVKRSVQSTIEQDITVARRPADPRCAGFEREGR